MNTPPPSGDVAAPTFLGMPPFPVTAKAALADDQLRRNLARATTTIRERRLHAIAELDDWEALRAAGAALKDEVLFRLPELLDPARRRRDRGRRRRALGP